MVQSTVTERKVQEGILHDIGGKWNERSPLVITKNGHVCTYMHEGAQVAYARNLNSKFQVSRNRKSSRAPARSAMF